MSRPIAFAENTGWTGPWQALGDDTDLTFVTSPCPVTADALVCVMDPMNDPGVDTGHTLTVKVAKDPADAEVLSCTVQWLDGTDDSVIAQTTVADVSSTPTVVSLTLSADEAAEVNYAQCKVRIIPSTGFTVSPALGTVTLTGLAPTVTPSQSLTAAPGCGTLALPGIAPGVFTGEEGNEILADSASRADVADAIAAASDGDTVLIPNGSATWTSGISTTKQIIIRAQNITPTTKGPEALACDVILTNSCTTEPMLSFTTGDTAHVGISGIQFNEGTGVVNHVRFSGSGSKVPLVSECYFEVQNRFGNEPDIAAIAWLSQGGVMWKTRIQGVGGGLGGQCCPEGASVLINSPRAWATASTMGSLDTDGTINVYIEDCSWKNFGQSPDVDDRGRVVIRYCDLDGVNGLTHGFTSSFGGRHFEYYNNKFSVTTQNRNPAGRYIWVRAGTGLCHHNEVNAETYGGWGTTSLLCIGEDRDSPPAGAYPVLDDYYGDSDARQPGWGHDGNQNVSDPIYVWANTGDEAYSYFFWPEGANSWGNVVVLNRDLFVNNGAKPNYTPYTYPHPLRS